MHVQRLAAAVVDAQKASEEAQAAADAAAAELAAFREQTEQAAAAAQEKAAAELAELKEQLEKARGVAKPAAPPSYLRHKRLGGAVEPQRAAPPGGRETAPPTVRGCAPEDHASADARRGAGDGPRAGDGETSSGQADAQFREYIIKVSAHRRPGPIARAVL